MFCKDSTAKLANGGAVLRYFKDNNKKSLRILSQRTRRNCTLKIGAVPKEKKLPAGLGDSKAIAFTVDRTKSLSYDL